MPPLSIVIKPASGRCNMRCRYCFYMDEARHRSQPCMGAMSPALLETVIRRALDYAETSCSFGFQGGEPTLAGLDFFRSAVALANRHNRKGLALHFALQTNGLLIDEEWAGFLHDSRFLVGLSLDGPAGLHNEHRCDSAGRGTFNRVMKAAQLLQRHRVEFNILSVVTARSARQVQSLYQFYMKNGLLYQQYIPCLDGLGQPPGGSPHSLTPKAYGEFLKGLFSLWYADRQAGKFVYIRYFENLAGILTGHAPESCGVLGPCMSQHVVEADGSVYPCDFYMLDNFRLGNLQTDGFETLRKNQEELGFIEASARLEPECRECQWLNLCWGGCRRHRQGPGLTQVGKNRFCSAYQEFFEFAVPKLLRLLRPR